MLSLPDLVLTALILSSSYTTAQRYRLPTVYSPSSYSVSLVLPSDIFNIENATNYSGNVTITFKVSKNNSEVVLHASPDYLNVTEVYLINGTQTLNVSDFSQDNITDILTVKLENELETNQEYNLVILFNGRLSTTDMNGLYKSSFKDVTNNSTSYLATTQMEATYARRVFPCFDEPSYKAQFNVTLTYPSGFTALANTKALSTSRSDDNTTVTTTFEPTPKMSTYLVAFMISQFNCSGNDAVEGQVAYQVCSRNETVDLRAWALEVAPLAVDRLESYLGLNYSQNIDKLDLVAIPDFSAGAMENWGLLTFRESALLYHANESSNAAKQTAATIIVHEIAHQWFGNSVTCNWWSEIFLNEGFATYFENFITNEMFPEYEMHNQFIIKTLQYVLEQDAASNEALRKNATTPAEISSRFGTETYDKGASILRMAEHVVGTELWKIGLNTYLKQYAYSTVQPDDLWNVLGANASLPAGIDLSLVMGNWVDHSGYPVVTVNRNGSQLLLSQEKFTYSNKTPSNVTWYIPITYTTSNNIDNFQKTQPIGWIQPESSLTLNLTENFNWIIINNLQTGYYRVNYDHQLWSALSAALSQQNFSGIPEINRAQIVDDAFNLARGGYLQYSQLFNITDFMRNETSYTVWYACFNGFQYLLRRVGQSSILGKAISMHLLNVSSSLIESTSLEFLDESDHIFTLKQTLAQSWACKLGDNNCTSRAAQLFSAFKNNSVRPNKNLRAIVYSYGIKSSRDPSDWQFLLEQLLSTSLASERAIILSALGYSEDESILNVYLQKTLVGTDIRSQDYAAVFLSVCTGSSVGVDVALDFFVLNFESIKMRYNSMNGISNILRAVAEQITTSQQLNKLKSFVETGGLEGTILAEAKKALALAQENQDWVNKYKNDLYLHYDIDVPIPTPSGSSSTTLCSSFLFIVLLAVFVART